MTVLWVALGAAVGAPTRYVVGHFLDGRVPWGTVLVNVLGSFVLGLLSGLTLSGDLPSDLSGEAMALLGVGFCGALTTYSAFAVQTVQRGARVGLLNALLTVPPALAACALGFALAPPS